MEHTNEIDTTDSSSEFETASRKQLLALKRVTNAAVNGALMPDVAEKVARDKAEETGLPVSAAKLRKSIADIANKIDDALDK